jgi:ABC-2 type transport system permease protein
MRDIFLLLKLQKQIFINSFKFSTKTEKIRSFFISFVALLFFVSVFIISYQVIIYISTLPVIGSLFTIRILGIAFLASFVMLIFSSLTVSLSTLYNIEDLQFFCSLPLNLSSIFIFKFLLTVVYSSWMVIIILLPFILSFVFVKGLSLYNFIVIIFAIGLKIIIAVSIGCTIAVVLSYIFPTKQLKNIVLVFLIILTAIGYTLFRFAEPEKLLDVDRFNELVQYLDFLSKPVAQGIPSWWVTEIFRGFMVKQFNVVGTNILKLFFITICVLIILKIFVEKLFYLSLFKTTKIKSVEDKNKNYEKVVLKTKPLFITVISKEVKSLIMEPMQWVQFVVVVALTIIYLFNIRKLPIQYEYVKITVAFFNLGGIMFILSAIVLRFVFVQPSLEYKMFWLIKSLPIDIKKFFLIKFFVYLPLVLIPGVVIVTISNLIIGVEKMMSVISFIIIFLSCIVLTISGYSLGILFPKKEYKDIAQIETSFGGLVFLLLSLCYIILLLSSLAEPVKKYVMFHPVDRFELFFHVLLFITINFIYAFTPGYYALKRFIREYA